MAHIFYRKRADFITRKWDEIREHLAADKTDNLELKQIRSTTSSRKDKELAVKDKMADTMPSEAIRNGTIEGVVKQYKAAETKYKKKRSKSLP